MSNCQFLLTHCSFIKCNTNQGQPTGAGLREANNLMKTRRQRQGMPRAVSEERRGLSRGVPGPGAAAARAGPRPLAVSTLDSLVLPVGALKARLPSPEDAAFRPPLHPPGARTFPSPGLTLGPRGQPGRTPLKAPPLPGGPSSPPPPHPLGHTFPARSLGDPGPGPGVSDSAAAGWQAPLW